VQLPSLPQWALRTLRPRHSLNTARNTARLLNGGGSAGYNHGLKYHRLKKHHAKHHASVKTKEKKASQ
jgi:hypothetical protein